jgi:hypothetical protein
MVGVSLSLSTMSSQRWATRIATSLIIVIFMLRVLMYAVSYKLFWNWFGVVRFVSHEVWFDREFVNWHFLHYCWIHIVLLQSLSIGVRIIYTTKELVDKIRNLKSNVSQNDQKGNVLWKDAQQANFFDETKSPAGKTCAAKCVAGLIFLTQSWWIFCPIDIVRNVFSLNHSSVSSVFNESIN